MPRRMTSPVLVGRTELVGQMRAAFDSTRAGEPRHVVLGGDAGMGKTRLLSETARLAEGDGARVLVGGCVSMGDEGLPYSPYAEIIRSLVSRDGATSVAAAAGRGIADLARLVPALGQGRHAPEQEQWAQTRLHEALLDLFRRYAARDPLVLQLEDLHWADGGTLAATAFLLRAISDEPICVVATFRTNELHRRHPLRPWLAEVIRSASVERIDLQPLGRDDIAMLVRQILSADLSPVELDEIARRAEGNPYFIEELLAARLDGGTALPWELRDVLLARVDALPRSAARLLDVAAVGGRVVEHGMLIAVLAEAEPAVEAELRRLAEAGLLLPVSAPDGDDAYAFRHALLQEAVYDAMLPTERRRLHSRWAEMLADHDAAAYDGPAYALQLAHHWREARDARALAASIKAGDAAMDSLSFATALREYEDALGLWDGPGSAGVDIGHVDLLERTARAAYLASAFRRAVAACREALDELGATDPAHRTVLLTLLGRTLWVSGDWGSSEEAYEQAVECSSDDPAIVRLKALAGLAQVYMLHARMREARPLCETTVTAAREIGARDLEGHALNTLGVVLAGLGETEAAFESIGAALEIALELGIADDIGRAYVNKPEIEAWCGYPELAFDTALEGMAVAADWGVSGSYGAWVGIGAVNFGFESGRWDEARQVLARADRTAGLLEGSALYRASYILELLACSGDDGFGPLWEEARRLSLERPASDNHGLLYLAGIQDAAFAGDHQRALDLAWEGIEVMRRADVGLRMVELARVAAWPQAALGRAARIGGDGEGLTRARDGMERLASLAREWNGEAARPGGRLGEVLAACERQVEAERERMEGLAGPGSWAAVGDAWVALGRPFRTAMARWRQAEVAEAARQRDEAAAALTEAFDIADRLGARPLLGHLEILARRLRVRLGTPSPEAGGATSRPYGLTSREAEVLAEVAAGRTNREIAEHLFISESTAGVHVSNILGKLGVSTRTEAARVALDQGLTESLR